MQTRNIRTRIHVKALELLKRNPEGLRFSELQRAIQRSFPRFSIKTINNSIGKLDSAHSGRVYKPAQGLYRLTEFKDPPGADAQLPTSNGERIKVGEEIFYPLFATWLKNELEDVTHAIALGGNAFRDRWGTPDVLGKVESRPSDVIKGPTSIVAAEIKVDTAGLVTGFGQACAYRLFSHKTYLVIPRQTPTDELARLDSLCQMFGLGLVVFNPKTPAVPDFKLLVRPRKHEPNLFYTNRYIKHVERQLF